VCVCVCRYEGEYVDSMQTGYGLMTWADGRRYEGYWVNSKCTGFGTLTHKDGRRYEGQYFTKPSRFLEGLPESVLEPCTLVEAPSNELDPVEPQQRLPGEGVRSGEGSFSGNAGLLGGGEEKDAGADASTDRVVREADDLPF